MVKRILVALDGSTTSEAALPHLQNLRESGAEVWLAQVTGGSERQEKLARAYLEGVAYRFRDWFPFLKTVVLSGEPAATLLETAIVERFDLIALTSRGRSNAASMIFGSVARRLLRTGTVPLFIVKVGQRPRPLSTILVPLDGSTRAKSILPLAASVAKASGGVLSLVTAVPFDRPKDLAQRYLDRIVESLVSRGVRARASVQMGDPVDRILEAARREKACLVAISTHGRSGVDRTRFGSVTETLLEKGRLPMLVNRTGGLLERIRARNRPKRAPLPVG